MQLSRSGAGGMWLVVAVAAGLGGTTPVAAAAMDTQPREKFTSASRYIGLYGVETSLVSALEVRLSEATFGQKAEDDA